jgi:two-component SAPR family response regulator
MELLCWAALHRDRPTVSAARTALWEINVQDATFHNVLSELRRGLATAGIQDGIRRRTRQHLVLTPLIATDAEVLRSALVNAEQAEDVVTDASTLDTLISTLTQVRGLPFAGQQYAWADAEGITSTFVWLVTRAVETACLMAQECGDDAAHVTAITAGLRMLPGDEHFISLRDAVAVGPRA